MNRSPRKLTIALATLLMSVASAVAKEPARTYEAHVRPILKTHCFQCHGEAGAKESGLDLRLRRFIVSGGESGPAVVPGNPSKSLLLERVQAAEMPPGDDKQLSPREIEIIEQWIAAGARTARAEPKNLGDGPIFTEEERNWWAFRPVKRPAAPSLSNPRAARNAIDAFLLARLEKAASDGEQPPTAYHFAPVASRETLIRRASFNLLGLPATPQEVADFERDDDPDAWGRLVDRLLASPHYGERWGRHWLDVAGYADSEGYTDEDRVRPHAFRYRDYVIRSFNLDKPYDRFITEQLAGDELIDAKETKLTAESIEKLTATGFLRMAPDGTGSSGVDENLARNQVVADTLQIVGASLLGLTVNCAQCHDHRYDPIPTVDYYRLRAVFEPALNWKNWKAPAARQISLYSDADRAARTRIEAEAKQVDDNRRKQAEIYITQTLEQELLLTDDAEREALRDAFRTAANKRTAEQKKLLGDHPSISNISEGALYLYERRREARARDIEAKRAEKLRGYLAKVAARELEKTPSEKRAAVRAALEVAPQKRDASQKALLKEFPRVEVTAASLAEIDPPAAADLKAYETAAAEIRKSRMKQHLQEFKDKAAKIRGTIPTEHFIRALREAAGEAPKTYVFFRGDHDQPKQEVQPSGLSILRPDTVMNNNPKEKVPTSGRRLQFARWLTSGRHPLVARVVVNRIWMHHFGRGLVNSPSDFGVLGDRPSHPDLLDWLAAEFVESGWSVKRLHRLIMTSAAYRQSSVGDARLTKADPENRLLGRMSIRRLDADALRDAVLAISGQMKVKLFGEPAPVMEDEVGRIVIGKENLDGERKPTKKIPLHGEEYRRSIYVQARRSRPLAVFDTFDGPTMTPNCNRRSVSNVAPQALLLMNSDFALSYSDAFADRLIREAGERTRDQLELGWRLAFGSQPTATDLDAAEQFVNLQQKTIRATQAKLKDAESRRQALASFCQALLGSNRFLYVE